MVPNLQVRKSQHMDIEFEGSYVQRRMQLIFLHLGWQAYTAATACPERSTKSTLEATTQYATSSITAAIAL
jgi:hypothetical protein